MVEKPQGAALGDHVTWVVSVLAQPPLSIRNEDIVAGLHAIGNRFPFPCTYDYDDDADRSILSGRSSGREGHVVLSVGRTRPFQLIVVNEASPDARDELYRTAWRGVLEHIEIPLEMIELVAKRAVFAWEEECNLNLALRPLFEGAKLADSMRDDRVYDLEFQALIPADEEGELRCRIECATNVDIEEVARGTFSDDVLTVKCGVARVAGFEGDLQDVLERHVADAREFLTEQVVPIFVRPVDEHITSMR